VSPMCPVQTVTHVSGRSSRKIKPLELLPAFVIFEHFEQQAEFRSQSPLADLLP
jgi:hypothetical protein